MSGIYIPGISMPEDGWHKAIKIFSDGTVVSYYDRTEIGKAIPVPDHKGHWLTLGSYQYFPGIFRIYQRTSESINQLYHSGR